MVKIRILVTVMHYFYLSMSVKFAQYPPPPPPLKSAWKSIRIFFILDLNNLFVIRIWASGFMTLSKTNLLAQYNWNQSLPVKPVKVVSPLGREQKTYPVQQRVYRWKYNEVPHLRRPWRQKTLKSSKHFYLRSELDLVTSFLPAISLAIDPSFNQDQDILVLPLDLLKYDTHEKLAQDVLNHFGKVTSDNS